jgi:hypothetical protein
MNEPVNARQVKRRAPRGKTPVSRFPSMDVSPTLTRHPMPSPRTLALPFSLGLAALSAVLAPQAQAYELPSINLGLTTFVDGAPPPGGPGLYLMSYLQPYSADHFKDQHGNDLALPQSKVRVVPWVNQFVYQSDVDVLGAKLGGMLLLPAVLSASLDDGADGAILGDTQTGMGDPVLGAYLQWQPVMGEQGPVFSQRVELDVTLPMGSYDKTKGLTPGANHSSIEAYWSGTWWVTPKVTASSRLFYLWNGKNSDPLSTRFASHGISEARDYQAGQAVHANLAVDYQLTPQWRIGLAGYWLQQLTETKVNGDALSGSKEHVVGVGPGAMVSFDMKNHLVFNHYTEMSARNRTEGQRMTLRYIHQFN